MFSVLVTGANRGIGLEFVRQLVSATPPPKHVFATCRCPRSAEKLQAIKKSCPEDVNLHILQMDVTKTEEIASVAKEVGRICKEGLTVLINNAGICMRQDILTDTSEAALLTHFRVNAVGPIMVMQAMRPLLLKAAERQNSSGMSCSRAAIINISSFAGSLGKSGVLLPTEIETTLRPYKVSKAALNMSMVMAANELKQAGVLVVVLCPGWVKTDMGTQLAELEVDDSVGTILTTMASLTDKNHGSYIDRFGQTIPW